MLDVGNNISRVFVVVEFILKTDYLKAKVEKYHNKSSKKINFLMLYWLKVGFPAQGHNARMGRKVLDFLPNNYPQYKASILKYSLAFA